jgi:hypothetical protein
VKAPRWTPEEATAIHKSIRRNHVAFNGWGRPATWDLPTLRATYPNLADTLKAVIASENGAQSEERLIPGQRLRPHARPVGRNRDCLRTAVPHAGAAMSRRTAAKLVYRYCRTEKARGQREGYLMALCTGLGAPFCTDQQWRDLTARLARQWHHLTATQRAVTPFPGE